MEWNSMWDKSGWFSFVLADSNIKQLDPEDMDEIEKIEYWRKNYHLWNFLVYVRMPRWGMKVIFYVKIFFSVKLLHVAK